MLKTDSTVGPLMGSIELHARMKARGALAVVVVAMCACEGKQSALAPRGPQAQAIYDLSLVMFIGATAIFTVVMVFVAAALAVRGPATMQRANPDNMDDRRRLTSVLAAALVTAGLLLSIFIYDRFTGSAIALRNEPALRIEVRARQWWWDVTYPAEPSSMTVRTANEIHIPVGVPVEIVLTSSDVIHSFWVPSLHGKMDAIPGRDNRLVIEASSPGVYRGQCAEFCGLQHALMAFVVIAQPTEEFERWRAHQATPAPHPHDEMTRRGLDVFLAEACVGCHAIRGTPAMGGAGPDLTHVASRTSLAAVTLDNRRGQLAGWILDPQHVKPGVHMPANDIAAEDLHALLHYLESLR